MTAALGLIVPPASRHILLEGFPLIKDKMGPPRVLIPSNEEIKLIGEMFHETYEGVGRCFLHDCPVPQLTQEAVAFDHRRHATLDNGKAYCVSVEVLMETGHKLSSIGEE